jgi:hypothetical protein
MGLSYKFLVNSCNFGSMSASGLVFVLIGYFTLHTKNFGKKYFSKIYHTNVAFHRKPSAAYNQESVRFLSVL